MHFLYLITNTINKKVYIGQAGDPSVRWSGHKSKARCNRPEQVITRAMIKHGIEIFTFEVIASSKTQDDTDIVEDQLIDQYDSRNPEKGYNVAKGGKTCPMTPETAQKISEAITRYYETRPGTNTGRTFGEEWRINISNSQAGKPRLSTRRFSEDIEKEICRLYVDENKSMYYLKNKFDCFSSLISEILIRNNIGIRQLQGRRFSEDVEKEICRLYVEEEKSTYALGRQFDCGRDVISYIIKKNNIKIRQSNYNKHQSKCHKFSPEQEAEICRMYVEEEKTIRSLFRQFDCSNLTIRNILIRNNIKIRQNVSNIFSFEQEVEICRLYVEEAKSLYLLGRQFDCKKTTIRDILFRHDIKL
jgi:group I intron endonuclease